jgi:hypothetical protein
MPLIKPSTGGICMCKQVVKEGMHGIWQAMNYAALLTAQAYG